MAIKMARVAETAACENNNVLWRCVGTIRPNKSQYASDERPWPTPTIVATSIKRTANHPALGSSEATPATASAAARMIVPRAMYSLRRPPPLITGADASCEISLEI